MNKPPPEPIVDARDVHKRYELAARSLEVLRGVRLAGPRGDFLALRGASGAGRRVPIAPARMNSLELILADEPTGNLDSHTGDEIIDLLCSLRAEQQTTLIIATHDSKVAARAPKVLELVDGQFQQ